MKRGTKRSQKQPLKRANVGVGSPLQIVYHYRESAIEDEILILTKMNWNSTSFAGALPITIRFSRQVGNIMREIPPGRDPMPQFAYYT